MRIRAFPVSLPSAPGTPRPGAAREARAGLPADRPQARVPSPTAGPRPRPRPLPRPRPGGPARPRGAGPAPPRTAPEPASVAAVLTLRVCVMERAGPAVTGPHAVPRPRGSPPASRSPAGLRRKQPGMGGGHAGRSLFPFPVAGAPQRVPWAAPPGAALPSVWVATSTWSRNLLSGVPWSPTLAALSTEAGHGWRWPTWWEYL